MKLIILLAFAGLSSAAKLDNTYLPPSHASTSGDSSGFLRAPGLPNQGSGNAGQGIYGPAPENNFASSNNFAPESPAPGNKFKHSQFASSINFAPSNNFASQSNNFNEFESQKPQERAQAAFERNAAILRLDNQNDGDMFSYAYETENGISADEQGVATNGVEAQGGFSYTGDDGQVYSIRYTADQNGFVPQGDHLPTPPPIPEEILQALQKNAQDEAAGIFDDGSYNEAKYNSGDSNGYNNGNHGYNYNPVNGNNVNGNQNYQPAMEAANDEDTVVTTNAIFKNQPATFNNPGPSNHNNNHGYNQGNSGITQAYLPPFQGKSDQASMKSHVPSFNQQPAYNNQGSFQSPSNQSFKNQSPGSQVNKYLPPQMPFESQRPSNQRSFNNQKPGFRNQESNSAINAYLPPVV